MREHDRISARLNSVICDSPALAGEGEEARCLTHPHLNNDCGVQHRPRGEDSLSPLPLAGEGRVGAFLFFERSEPARSLLANLKSFVFFASIRYLVSGGEFAGRRARA